MINSIKLNPHISFMREIWWAYLTDVEMKCSTMPSAKHQDAGNFPISIPLSGFFFHLKGRMC